jgi:acylphosphatase
MICVRCVVSGRVQGVWYRASTRSQAELLGVTGYARNRSDGTVEVLACGEPQAVAALRQWLWQGPDQAQVDDVSCESRPFEHYSGFSTR